MLGLYILFLRVLNFTFKRVRACHNKSIVDFFTIRNYDFVMSCTQGGFTE